MANANTDGAFVAGTLHRELGSLSYTTTRESGPLIVMAHGIGNDSDAYRFLAPLLDAKGYRVVSLDLRGCGRSSAEWPSYTRTDIAEDLLALIAELGGPAVVVGHSISGGAATIAAATAPAAVRALVEIAPFTRKARFTLGALRLKRFRQGALAIAAVALTGSRTQWRRYLEIATPEPRPADWTASLDRIDDMLGEPGRTKALRRQMNSAADAEAHLPGVQCPVLVIQGDLDPDWAAPEAEGREIVAALPPGLGTLEVIRGAGHYPHVQFPGEVSEAILRFVGTLDA